MAWQDHPAYTQELVGPIDWLYDTWVQGPTTDPVVAFSLQPEQLNNKLLVKIKDQSINLAQAYAERAQTSSLIYTSAKRIATAAFMLRKGNWVEASRHLGYSPTRREREHLKRAVLLGSKNQRKILADSWVELQYGWKPLLSDVQGAALMLAKNAVEGKLIESARVQKEYLKKASNKAIYKNYYSQIQTTLTRSATLTELVKMKVWYSIDSPLAHTFAQSGILDPLVLGWELLPWSFVVDWFLPVGNWLNSFNATVGLTFLTGYQSKEYEYLVLYENDKGHYLRSEQSYIRTPLTAFPSPTLPRPKNPVSSEHIANAMALLQQAFFRR